MYMALNNQHDFKRWGEDQRIAVFTIDVSTVLLFVVCADMRSCAFMCNIALLLLISDFYWWCLMPVLFTVLAFFLAIFIVNIVVVIIIIIIIIIRFSF